MANPPMNGRTGTRSSSSAASAGRMVTPGVDQEPGEDDREDA